MNIRLVGGLPYVRVSLTHRGNRLDLDHVVLDTGSGGSIFSADELQRLDIVSEPEDRVYRIVGVGGQELVFSKRLEGVALGEMELQDFEVQIGAMNYGFPIQGIIGMNFLLQFQAVIDLGKLEVIDGR
jgi:predicted aspartyl protease